MFTYLLFLPKILIGLFIPTKLFQPQIKIIQIFSRFTWEIPQTLLALLVFVFLFFSLRISSIIFSHGAVIIKTKGKFGGFTLSNFIIGDGEIEGNPSQRLFQHEFGHVLQSLKSGPIYLIKYGLPSLISAYRNKGAVHAKHPVEQDANVQAKTFWDTNYQHTYLWNEKYNPIYKSIAPATIML